MQHEKDFIEREIQRLNLFLKKLIDKVYGLKDTGAADEMKQVESALNEEFDLNLSKLAAMKDRKLQEHLKDWNEEHLEKLVELIMAVIENFHSTFGQDLARKGVVILEYIDSQSNTFSMKRMQLKRDLSK